MNRFIPSCALLCIFWATQASHGDTVTFPDGSTMDGVVREINENCIEFDIGETQFILQRTEIASFEKNEKRTAPGKTQLPMVEAAEQEITQTTGLTQEQRDEVLALILAIWNAEDPAERTQLESRLIELSRRLDVVKFIQASYEPAQIRNKMPLLNALALIRPSSALEPLRLAMVSGHPEFRGFALRLYARTLKATNGVNKDSVRDVARGLVDHNTDVQLAAAFALVECGTKETTPVLVAALKNVDPRVQNASNQALGRIWQIDPDQITEDRATHWEAFWKSNAPSVSDSIDPESLAPLVDKDAPVEDTHH
ncbi:MAG: hypothetical protein AMXMBFR84_41020 [Candidatus Hydrogenedentota bacterium]